LRESVSMCLFQDSTDKPKHELKIEETIVFVNPYETDLKVWFRL
jgi:hypothetical protein